MNSLKYPVLFVHGMGFHDSMLEYILLDLDSGIIINNNVEICHSFP